MEKLRILLKNGESKTFPWENIGFKLTENYITVWKVNAKLDNFLFKAPISNVEYAERITDEAE